VFQSLLSYISRPLCILVQPTSLLYFQCQVYRRKLLLGSKTWAPTFQYLKARLLLSPPLFRNACMLYTLACVSTISVSRSPASISWSSDLNRSIDARMCSICGTSPEATVPDDYGQLDEVQDEVGGRGRRSGRSSQGPLDQLRDYCGPHGCYPCSRCTTRFQLALLSSVGFCISFGIRCNMGLAVLQMTSNATRWTLAPIVNSIHQNLTFAMVRTSTFNSSQRNKTMNFSTNLFW